MSDQNIPTSAATQAASATKKRRSAQDQALANYITTALTRLQAASQDTELTPQLSRRGIRPEKLAEGIALGTQLQSRFTDRQRKEEADNKGLEAIAETRKALQRGFTTYRETVRLAYPALHATTLQATADRDSAAALFNTWMATYNRAARLIAKEHPELAARLL